MNSFYLKEDVSDRYYVELSLSLLTIKTEKKESCPSYDNYFDGTEELPRLGRLVGEKAIMLPELGELSARLRDGNNLANSTLFRFI